MFDTNQIEYMNNTYCDINNPDAIFYKSPEDAYGSTYDLLKNKETGCNTILVVFDGLPHEPEMAHESFHVMNGILKYVDLEFNFSKTAGNEHLAYIIEWSVKCICNAIEKEKKCKKKTK